MWLSLCAQQRASTQVHKAQHRTAHNTTTSTPTADWNQPLQLWEAAPDRFNGKTRLFTSAKQKKYGLLRLLDALSQWYFTLFLTLTCKVVTDHTSGFTPYTFIIYPYPLLLPFTPALYAYLLPHLYPYPNSNISSLTVLSMQHQMCTFWQIIADQSSFIIYFFAYEAPINAFPLGFFQHCAARRLERCDDVPTNSLLILRSRFRLPWLVFD